MIVLHVQVDLTKVSTVTTGKDGAIHVMGKDADEPLLVAPTLHSFPIQAWQAARSHMRIRTCARVCASIFSPIHMGLACLVG